MVTRSKTLKSYNMPNISPNSDTRRALFDTLRAARLNRGLSQQDLARKLGLHQRQISDLERASMDPRLSTVQNVARALDFEVLIVPRHLIPAIEGLLRGGHESPKRPLYALTDEDADSDRDTESVMELGSEPAPTDQPTRRRPQEPR